jgi:hypothetical protein
MVAGRDRNRGNFTVRFTVYQQQVGDASGKYKSAPGVGGAGMTSANE